MDERNEIIKFVLDEVMRSDGELQLEPVSILHPLRRIHMKRRIYERACKEFDLELDDWKLSDQEAEAKRIFDQKVGEIKA